VNKVFRVLMALVLLVPLVLLGSLVLLDRQEQREQSERRDAGDLLGPRAKRDHRVNRGQWEPLVKLVQ
jgi:hypothetical protein